ncbi:MAG: hypothetical protein V3U28_08035, partial [Candidatus Acidoferrales bacterium]
MRENRKKFALPSLLLAALLVSSPAAVQPQASSPAPAVEALSAEAVIERLMAANRRRDELLAGWQVRRRYHLKNEIYE